MKKLVLCSIVVLLVSSGAVVTQAQAPPAPRATGDASKARGWRSITSLPTGEPFVSLEGRFSIALPKNVQGFEALSPKKTGTSATGQQFSWKFEEAEIVGFFLDNPDSFLTGSPEDLAIIASRSKTRLETRVPNAKLVAEAKPVPATVPYAFFLYDVGKDGFISTHLFLSGKRVYQFSISFKLREVEDRLNRTIATFSLISQADVDAVIREKYENLKPAPLLQTPVVNRLTSDAQNNRLKGKVAKVISESEDRSGTWGVQGKKLSSVEFYDESGALTQRDSYDSQGNPFQITVYGYLDGKRVSNSRIIRYEYDPPPMAAPPGAKATESIAKRDARYEYSFEYKYENGKLIERRMKHNDGSNGMRYVYRHSPNQMEELVYTAEGKLNQRYLSVLDAGGNVIERTDFGVVNFDLYGDRKYRNSYEFDSAGNWTKMTTLKEVKDTQAARWDAAYVTYRTISYY